MQRKKAIKCITFFLMFVCVLFIYDKSVVFAKEKIVVVIDPGHGGENLGTDYLPVPEKYYTMIVAKYMKQHLEQFENIEVYMTHEEDVDMSLKERAEFAQDVNADFLFSLHFNMSLPHTLYGSEVWIPSDGMLYSQGYSMANEFVMQFEEMGLFNRGIKTRIGKSGTDYYGIIRQCAIRGIPAIIVEHCHVDNKNDEKYMQEDSLREFGIRNAEAVARYFGLRSETYELDFSEYAPLAVSVPAQRMHNDITPPEYTELSLVHAHKTGRYVTVELKSEDIETSIQYYAYSTDNGISWSEYFPWKSEGDNMLITLRLPYKYKENRTLKFKTSNLYDLQRESEIITY